MIDFSRSRYSQKARQFLSKKIEDFKFFTLLDGSVRSGKTINIIYKIPHMFLEIGNENLKVFSGYSKNTVRNNVLTILKPYLEHYHRAKVKYNSASGELDITLHKKLYNCLVVGGGKSDSDSAIQGSTWDFWYPNELPKHNYAFYNMALTRLSSANARVFADSNPESPNHWLYKEKIKPYLEFDEKVREVFEYWNFTMDDNLNLHPEYVENQKKLYTGVFYDRKILGKWKVAEGLVYDTFDEEKHTLSHEEILKLIKENQLIDIIVGVDWGYNHPTACLLIGVDREFNYYIIDELYSPKIEAIDVVQWLKEKQVEYQRFVRIINADNSRPEQNHKLREHWTTYEEKPSVADSIAIVRSAINYDRIYINRDRCPNTLNEILTYRYPSEDERYKITMDKWDNPIKEVDDAVDALRYIIYTYETRFARRIIR